MLNDNLTRIYEGDWQECITTNQVYGGKYYVGRFKIENVFILEYMALIHDIEIPNHWLSYADDINEQKVIYMETSDILTKSLFHKIREMIKKPPNHIQLYRSGNRVVKIEIQGSL